MSTATAAEVPVPARGKKKLILIVAVASLLLAIGGGAAAFLLKKGAGAEAADAQEEDVATAEASSSGEARVTPIFVPLDPFTVNLADRNADRYAQVGITLEIDSTKTGDQIKTDQDLHAGHPQQHPDGHCRPHGGRPAGPRGQGGPRRTRQA